MNGDSDSSSFWTSVATAAPIFALLVVLRVTAPAVVVQPLAPQELVIAVYDTGWAIGVGGPAEAGEIGPGATWIPRSLGQDAAALRRAAREMQGDARGGNIRVVADRSACGGDLDWTARTLAQLGGVAVDAGPIASMEARRPKKNARRTW
jgi:hypothetical protein